MRELKNVEYFCLEHEELKAYRKCARTINDARSASLKIAATTTTNFIAP